MDSFVLMVVGFCAAVAVALTPVPANVVVAAGWAVHSIVYLVSSKDTAKPKAPPAPLSRARGKKVRVVFIRHGDSVWNSLVNRFGVAWPVRAIRYAVETLLLVLGNRNDSVVIDSPLSPLGEQQAAALARFVATPAGQEVIPTTDTKTSVVVSSNLRRAMATALVGLEPRLRQTREKVVIDSALQEGSRNADAQSFMQTKGRLADSPVLGYATAAQLGAVFDPALSLGNKTRSGNVFDRIDAFTARIFGEGPHGLPTLYPVAAPSTVVCVGHSLWFKHFFGRYLPAGSTHVAKQKKMKNCGVVAFDLFVDEKGVVSIDEASINAAYLGFNK